MAEDNNATSVERKSTVFETLAHPVLRSVDLKKVAVFLRERARYELEVDERRKEVPTMTVASYAVSVDRILLENMITVDALDIVDIIAPGVSIEEITDAQIESYVKSIVTRHEGEEIDPAVIEKAIENVRMQMDIEDPSARILEFAKLL